MYCSKNYPGLHQNKPIYRKIGKYENPHKEIECNQTYSHTKHRLGAICKNLVVQCVAYAAHWTSVVYE